MDVGAMAVISLEVAVWHVSSQKVQTQKKQP